MSSICEFRKNSNEINYPINSALFSLVYHIPSYLISPEAIYSGVFEFFRESFEINEDSMLPALMLLTLIPSILYLYKKAYDQIYSFTHELFPNGFTYHRNKHGAYEALTKLETKEQIDTLISAVEKLIEEQKVSSNKIFYGSLLASIVLPYLSGFTFSEKTLFVESGALSVNLKLTGPQITFKSNTTSIIPNLIQEIAGDQQGLRFYSAITKYWDNFFTPRELATYASRLNHLSCLNKSEWIYDPSDKKEKAIFSLKINTPETQFKNTNGSIEPISKSIYMKELHRILIEEKFVVYSPGKQAIYIGYSPLSEKRAHKIRLRLKARLTIIQHQRKQIEKIITSLNSVTHILYPMAHWEAYNDCNIDNQIESYYYLNTEKFSPEFLSNFENNLKEFVPNPEKNITKDGNIIKIHSVNEIPKNKLLEVKNSLKILMGNINNRYSKPTLFNTNNNEANTLSIPNKVHSSDNTEQSLFNEQSIETLFRKPALKKSTIASLPVSPLPKKNSIYPKSILFPRNGEKCVITETIEENVYEQDKRYFDKTIFPLNVRWFPMGRAYVAIDKEILSQTEKYIPNTRIINTLQNGHVNSIKSANKTKSGAVGIKLTQQPYVDIHGNSHTNSNFKMKFTNNIRIFARVLETFQEENGENRILYIFDGCGYGH
ncbi:MAG: hypothetical protein LEGION0398_MBIBDBAK_01145 [Legionellaceae bacterium]